MITVNLSIPVEIENVEEFFDKSAGEISDEEVRVMAKEIMYGAPAFDDLTEERIAEARVDKIEREE